jgi:hypothetical protein
MSKESNKEVKRIRTYQLEPLKVVFNTTYENEPTFEEVLSDLEQACFEQLKNIIKGNVCTIWKVTNEVKNEQD